MAVSAIGGVGNFVSFIPPLPSLQQITPQQGFAQVVERSLSGATVTPTALTSTSDGARALAALEQALFNDWIATLQSLQVPSATSSSFDRLLAAQLDLTAALGAGTSQSPFGLTTGVTPDLTSSIVSLFDAMQLLGIQTSQRQQVGSLLDLLA